MTFSSETALTLCLYFSFFHSHGQRFIFTKNNFYFIIALFKLISRFNCVISFWSTTFFEIALSLSPTLVRFHLLRWLVCLNINGFFRTLPSIHLLNRLNQLRSQVFVAHFFEILNEVFDLQYGELSRPWRFRFWLLNDGLLDGNRDKWGSLLLLNLMGVLVIVIVTVTLIIRLTTVLIITSLVIVPFLVAVPLVLVVVGLSSISLIVLCLLLIVGLIKVSLVIVVSLIIVSLIIVSLIVVSLIVVSLMVKVSILVVVSLLIVIRITTVCLEIVSWKVGIILILIVVLLILNLHSKKLLLIQLHLLSLYLLDLG